MDILIKNMEMPKGCVLEEHLSDGTIVKHKAIPVPPHGDLIDVDTLSRRLVKWEEEALFDKDIVRASAYRNVRDILNECAVVLERTT